MRTLQGCTMHLMSEDPPFGEVKIYPMTNSFNLTGLESFFGTFS
jgi:hypothetical protein